MAGGLSYDSWKDAPVGAQAREADKIIQRFRDASSQVGTVMKETPQPQPVAAPVRLIDANALIKEEKMMDSITHGMVMAVQSERILEAPTVDAEEVVRCKDCAVPHNRWTGCPNLNGLIPPDDFYCAYGERR